MARARVAPHVHSEWSYDANWPLRRLASFFGRLGYDAVLMAEHDRGFDEERWGAFQEACAGASTGSCVLVPGIEYSDADNVIHIPVWGSPHFLGEGIATAELLDRAANHNAVSVFAHPLRRRAIDLFDTKWLDRLQGVEWWNRKYDGYAPSTPEETAHLRQTPMPFVGMDFHSLRQLVPFGMAIELDGDLTPPSVFEAMRNRRCRPEVMGMPALRFTSGRGLRVASQLENTRKLVARMVQRL
jgi:hypothetical protein